MIYKIVSLLLSHEYETIKSRVGDILNEYLRDCLREEESLEKFSSLISDLVAYVGSRRNAEGFLTSLRERILEGRELREVATVIFRELCDPELASIAKGWRDDMEPAVRMAYLKCLLKLFESGGIGIEELSPFAEDPSPRIRIALASALSLHTNRSEVRSLLLRMLGRERRSEVRNAIMEALSSHKT